MSENKGVRKRERWEEKKETIYLFENLKYDKKEQR